ncbi:MAG: Gfo/Idh/MocA family oxidoreductase, partial [Kiritimatiellae bacterium]|nr:Gfo/Idh/MocA family oxidoreductase [Kiritimatiellia bacterium]
MFNQISCDRRAFLAGAFAASFMGGCRSFGNRNMPVRRIGANSKVNVGIIGCGLIAKGTNVPGFLKDPRCRVTVACDIVKVAPGYFYGKKPVNSVKSDVFEGDVKYDTAVPREVCGSTIIKNQIDRHYGDTSCREVFDWREVVNDPTIDAVCICTPDHWHAIIAIAAMRAGKHVFCQKPMSLSIAEGKAMAAVAKETGVTFQTGNQGRSNPDYIFAEMLALNGYGGKITGGLVSIPGGDHWVGHGRSEARAPLPKWMSPEAWEMWQGPAQHWENNAFIPSIHEPTCWRFNKRYGNGMVADFGAHEFDEIQRGLGTDLTGPVRVENVKSDLAPEDKCKVFSWANKFSF